MTHEELLAENAQLQAALGIALTEKAEAQLERDEEKVRAELAFKGCELLLRERDEFRRIAKRYRRNHLIPGCVLPCSISPACELDACGNCVAYDAAIAQADGKEG